MKPKEKAEELVHNFRVNVVDEFEPTNSISNHKAKQCALIAVNEIINEYKSNICNSGYDYDFERWDMQRDYWKEVQFEISKLITK